MSEPAPNLYLPLDRSLIDVSIRDAIVARPIEMPQDWPLIREIHDSSRERDGTDLHSVCYRIPNLKLEQYSKLISEAPVTILASIHGQAVAHGWMETWGDQEIAYLWRVWVKPDFRKKGVGTALLRWGETCALQMQTRSGKPGKHLANATEHEADAVELLRAEDYGMNFISPELAFDDWHLLDSSARPSDGIDIRLIREDEVGQVIRCLAEANLPPPETPGRTADETEREIAAARPHFQSECDRADLGLSRGA